MLRPRIAPLLLASLSIVFLIGWAPIAARALTFTATLDGPSEEPPNASLGTGVATVEIDPVAHTLSVQVSFSGLSGQTTVAHIHVINGPGDTNTADTVGPVATTTPSFPGFPTGVTFGDYSELFDTTQAASYRAGWITDSGSVEAAEAALFAGIQEGRAYLNVHSSLFQGGEIRGFLVLVPEPSTALLFGAGLAGLVARGRSRKG